MKGIKKGLIILLSLILLLALAACGEADAPAGGGDAPPTGGGGDAPAGGGDAQPGVEAGDRWAQRVQASLATVAGHEGWDYAGGDPYARFIAEKFNIEVELINLPWDQWASQLRLWINAMDMPDAVVWNYSDTNHVEGTAFVDQGLVKRLPDNWTQEWPTLAAMHATTGLGPRLDEIFGGTYWLPRARFFHNLDIIGDPLSDHLSVTMRLDWLEALDFPIRAYYNIFEVLEFARLVQAQDPDNHGDNLVPIALTPANAAQMFLNRNFAHWNTFYRGADGLYTWGPMNERTREGMMLWYQAWEDGLIYREFYLLGGLQDRNLFNVAARTAIHVGGAPTHGLPPRFLEFEEANPELNPRDHIHIATQLGTDNLFHQRDLINFWGTYAFSPDIAPATFERLMDMLDWSATWEGYTITNMGVPDLDFYWDADRNPVSLVPEGEILIGTPGVGARNPSMGNVLFQALLQDDFQLDNPNLDVFYRELSAELYRNRVEMSNRVSFPYADWDLWFFDSPAMRQAAGILYSDEFTNIILNATSMDNMLQLFDEWISAHLSIVQPLIDELNAAFPPG